METEIVVRKRRRKEKETRGNDLRGRAFAERHRTRQPSSIRKTPEDRR